MWRWTRLYVCWRTKGNKFTFDRNELQKTDKRKTSTNHMASIMFRLTYTFKWLLQESSGALYIRIFAFATYIANAR